MGCFLPRYFLTAGQRQRHLSRLHPTSTDLNLHKWDCNWAMGDLDRYHKSNGVKEPGLPAGTMIIIHMIYLSSRDDRLLYRFDFSHKPVCDYTLSFFHQTMMRTYIFGLLTPLNIRLQPISINNVLFHALGWCGSKSTWRCACLRCLLLFVTEQLL